MFFIAIFFSLTIRDIQYTTNPSGNSPYEGQWVTVTGIVTAGNDEFSNRFFIADAPGPWSGIMVYAPNHPTIRRGDSVLVYGLVQEYYNMTELDISNGGYVQILGRRKPPHPPVKVTLNMIGEAYEGCLVVIENSRVISVNSQYNEWRIRDSTGSIWVGSWGNTEYNPNINDSILIVRGVVVFTYGNFKLMPRGFNDLFLYEPPILPFFSHNVMEIPGYSIPPRGNYNLDSLVTRFIRKATFSIDVAIYYLSSWNVVQALKNQFDKGIRIRVIVENENINSQVQSLISYGIQVIDDSFGPNSGENLMHNKFVIIDARDSSSTIDDHVLTGSFNFIQNWQTSNNNILIIRSPAVAYTYTLEFNEMWGSSTDTPNPASSRFSTRKTDNTPHVFNIEGRQVEVYFSPSDNVASRIIQKLQTANESVYFVQNIFTNYTIANQMKNLWDSGRVMVAGVFDSVNYLDPQYLSVSWAMTGLGGQNPWNPPCYVKRDYLGGIILHSKYMIIDPDLTTSSPMVITGSMNLTVSGISRNDENTIIIMDSIVSLWYYQDFALRYMEGQSPSPFPPGYFPITTIQQNDPSSLESKRLRTLGKVTGEFLNISLISMTANPPSLGSGIFISAQSNQIPPNLSTFDSVYVMGIVREISGVTTIDVNPGKITVLQENPTEPQPLLINCFTANQESFEGLLVVLDSVLCTNYEPSTGDWIVEDNSGSLIISGLGYRYEPIPGFKYRVKGVIYQEGQNKLLLRFPSDVIPLYLRGDLNGDGIINIQDFRILGEYLYYHSISPNPHLADLNSDGIINDLDLVKLATIIFRQVQPH